ncbi:MAG: spondin domain-containing protein [Oleispira sp.]
MKYLNRKAGTLAIAILSASLLSACGSSSNDNANETDTVSYDITVTNLTSNQPLSPLFAQLHSSEYSAWKIGSAASENLEILAEGGDNSALLNAQSSYVYSAVSGVGAIGPGVGGMLSIEADVNSEMSSDLKLTLISMLVNTNDAFVGKTGMDLSSLAVGQTVKYTLPTYDSGTEANSELAGTIPGPADGGEGFNMARDDVDYVARHPGVVGVDQGYSESVLNSTHGFDSPTAVLTITRTE